MLVVLASSSMLISGVVLGVESPASAATYVLVVTTQPSLGEVSGTVLVTQPVVKVEDGSSIVITAVNTGTVTASTTTVGCAITSGATSNTITSGVAIFSGLTMTAASGVSCVITFSDTPDAYVAVDSNSVHISTSATHLHISTQPASSAFSGAALTQQPVVQVLDASNTIVMVDSSLVTATITTPGVGTLSNASMSAVAGTATFTNLALNASAGAYTLTFTGPGLASDTSTSINVTTGGAAKLAILVQPPTTAASGAALTQQPQVVIEDSGGNRVTSNNSPVTATFTSGGVSITNNFATAASGLATFSGTALNALAGPYTITFSDGSLTAVVSNTVTVGAGTATQLVVTTQPSSAVASGVALAVQPVVKIEDSGGNVVTSNYATVTATLTSSVYTLSHATATASAGVATYSGLALNAPTGTYTLTFSDSPLVPAVSGAVSVTSGAATKLVITTQPSSTDASGVALVQVPVVKVEDAAGNVVTSDSSVVVAKITSGGVSISNGAQTAAGGVAAFNGLALNALVGTYTLTLTDGTLSSAISTSVTVIVGPANQLVVTTEPSPVAASGVALATQPVVTARDSGGNVVTSVNSGLATAGIVVGVGGAISAGATAPFVLGRAAFSGLAITGVSGVAYGLIYTGAALSVSDTARITIGTAQSPLYITTLKGWHGRNLRLATRGGSGTGGVTYAVVGGTAHGCRMSGAVLLYLSTGTCIVTATKAGSGAYQPVSSSPTTIRIVNLPIPHMVIVQFNRFSSALSSRAHHDLILLSRQLTSVSVVKVFGYAPGNSRLAKLRGLATLNYLRARVRAHFNLVIQTRTRLDQARVTTVSQ
jgi:hypothetical protein